MPLSNAEKCRRRRERLKNENPEQYKKELAAAKARNKSRRESMKNLPKDDPKKQDYLGKENERQKQYQAKKKTEELHQPSPPMTRCEIRKAEEKREKNRQYKADSRARRSHQKISAERRKDAERQQIKRDQKKQEMRSLSLTEACTQADFVTPPQADFVTPPQADCVTPSHPSPNPSLCKIIKGVVKDLNPKRDPMSLFFKDTLKTAFSNAKQSLNHIGLSRKPVKSRRHEVYRRFWNGKMELVQEFYTENSVPDPSKPHRRQLLKPVKELFSEFKLQHPSVRLSLRSFYRYKPRSVASVKMAKFRQCLCDVCLNPKLKLQTINRLLSTKCECVRDLLVESVCEFEGEWPDRKCVERNCGECGVCDVRTRLENELSGKLGESVSWFAWEMVKEGAFTRLDRVKKTGTLQECLDGLLLELDPLYLHVFTADWQRRQLRDLKSDLPSGWALVFCDYSENFQCKMQDAAQSTYYSQKQVTLFPAVAFYQCPCSEGIRREEIAFFSDDLRHDAYLTQACVDRIVSTLQERLGSSLKKVILASDGCAAQFKSKLPFLLYSRSVYPDVSVEKVFFGSRHGKNDSDWSGGAIKRLLNRYLATGTDFRSAKDVYQHCADYMTVQCSETACEHKVRQFQYIEQCDVVRAVASSSVKTVSGCRRFHHLRSEAADNIHTRHFSCFCDACRGEEFDLCHSRVAHRWIPRKIICEQPLGSQEEDSDEEMPLSQSPSDDDGHSDSDLAVDSAADVSSESEDDGDSTVPCMDSMPQASCTQDRLDFFSTVQERLAACGTYEELKKEANELMCSVAEFPLPNQNASTEHLSTCPEDTLASNLLPQAIRDRCKPLQVYGDGNCFFRSLSLLVYGDEESHTEMRVRTVMAMCSEEAIFLHDRHWSSPCRTPEAEVDAEQLVSLCIDSAHIRLQTPELTFRRECLHVAQMNTYSGLWEFMAAAVALSRPVQSVIHSPDLPPVHLKNYNQIFRPPGCNVSDKLRVMWTQASSQHQDINHLVPLCLQGPTPKARKDSIYLTRWSGKLYPCQVLEIDELLGVVCVHFMSSSRGYWIWKYDDYTEYSWEPVQNLVGEVSLTIVNHLSTQRCQYFKYSNC